MYLKINALGDYKKKYDPFARLLALKRGVGVCSVVGVVSGFYGSVLSTSTLGGLATRSTSVVNVNAVNCHGHGRANFRPHIDHVLTTHPGHLTLRGVGIPVYVFLTLIFEFFHTSVRLYASCACAVTAMWC